MRDQVTRQYFNWKVDYEPKDHIYIDGSKLNKKQVAMLAGAPSGSFITTYVEEHDELGTVLAVYAKNNFYKSSFYIYRTDPGVYAIYWDSFIIAEGHRDQLWGTRMFAYMVKMARKLGFKSISGLAMRVDGHYNGYYTWPRLGFQGKIPQGIVAKLPKNLKFVSNVEELMSDPEGCLIWKEKGGNIEVEFDLDPESISSMTLDAYLKEKGIKL
jgi:GNAT superfamily N-acetyltransferase